MSNFIMLVGLPGAGKSTIAQKLVQEGYVWHSTDNIRNELNIHEIERITEVLDILTSRLLDDMQAGKNIVYDSTNLSRRRRIKVLEQIECFNYKKICYVVDTDIDTCKERNSHRTGYSKVSDYEYDIMEHHYTKPTYKEGWDEIIYF